MSEGKDKDINPVEPLGDPEPVPAGEIIGRRNLRFSKIVPPIIRSAEDANVIHLVNVKRPKGNPPGGAA
jgi:hypothetical protein